MNQKDSRGPNDKPTESEQRSSSLLNVKVQHSQLYREDLYRKKMEWIVIWFFMLKWKCAMAFYF